MSDLSHAAHRLSLEDLRENYTFAGLNEQDCDPNPIVQFERWFKQAQEAGLKEPNAMTLATATADGRPSARIVLLKEVSDLGFIFYTNYGSRKAQEFERNALAALTFYWAELERQVRVEGRVEKVDRAKSEAYFRRRPRGSKIGAWVSRQSNMVDSRATLEARLNELEAKFAGQDDVPAPDFWGGFIVLPEMFEFWQGRPNRLHDRIVYRRSEFGWTLERLWP